ncbi:MAG: Xaa-Pro aminopeptidase [Ignavibacteriae bacterium]|nr:Xaa-Pro aminopeptidase [Ignavibacteriota bacterium]
MPHRHYWILLVLLLAPALMFAQEAEGIYQTDFPPDEFKARWEKIFNAIGDNAVAVVQGAPQVRGFALPRQYNEFYYLCGIETPFAYIKLDGRNRKVTLYLPPRNPRLERSEGKVLSADDAELVKRLTGVDEVLSNELTKGGWLGDTSRTRLTLYVPHQPGEGYAESRGENVQANVGIATDYWDGRLPREGQFIQLLRTRHPRVEIRDLTPILDELRAVKSTREIALIRRASELSGHAIVEAIKSAEAGMYEYELEAAARYVYTVNGSRMDGYRAIIAAGTDNIWNAHYFRNNSLLKDGDLVLMDYAPDYRYYTSDVARMFPVNGKFSPVQKEILGFVLAYRNEIMKRIRPGVTAQQIMDEAKVAMEPILKRTKFFKPAYEKAARTLVERGGGVFSHPVGMAVHDDGGYRQGPLKPEHVFSVDPQLWVPEENLYYRYEDVIVITETGYENFTDFLPSELTDIEKLMREDGIVQKVPRVK